MAGLKLILVSVALIGMVSAHPSAVDVLQDMYSACLKDFSVSCIKPKALFWMNAVSGDPIVRITEDLVLVKKADKEAEVNLTNVWKVCVLILFYFH